MSQVNSWPFKEANRLLRYLNNTSPEKGFVLFETGYGPSGIPHIGTFAEVLRTSFVIKAFQQISSIPTKLICFSDDFDGLRKIPDNIPKDVDISNYIDIPLTYIPDPFKKEKSFGDYMNKKLCTFLDHFGFEYEFHSSTACYQSGKFDKFLVKILERHQEIIDIIAPTLGEERQKNYSPFLPICPTTGKVLQVKIEKINLEKHSISYFDNNNNLVETKVTGGNVKLQWKPDFGMRWAALDVDFEIYGKEHSPNASIYQKICKLLGGKPPIQFVYELFLDKNGAKISKSKGNSISLDDLIKYSPLEAISLFIYNAPQRAKKLDWNIIPQVIDEYLLLNQKYFDNNSETLKKNNPLYHIHKSQVPHIKYLGINFSFLLNLISACNNLDPNFLWQFIEKDHKALDKITHDYFFSLLDYAIKYYRDILNKNKSILDIDEEQKTILKHILNMLETVDSEIQSEDIQNKLYQIGKDLKQQDLKQYFKKLYKALLGQEQGPRLGSFIRFFGIENTKKLIRDKIM